MVTLNLSIVVMMIAGVVRKKRRMKRTTLITRQRIHQMKPRMERCSLRGVSGEEGIRNSHTEPHTHSRHSPACTSRAWGTIPSFPLLSQGPTLAQPGKNNSFSYQCEGAPISHHWGPEEPHSLSPVDVLWVRGIADSPVGNVKGLAAGRGLGLPAACTALALASVEVFEDSGEEGNSGDGDTQG